MGKGSPKPQLQPRRRSSPCAFVTSAVARAIAGLAVSGLHSERICLLRTNMIDGVVALVCSLSVACMAMPVEAISLVRSDAAAQKSPYVQPVHGFHCRPMYGWDARFGIYHRHTHPGICANYQRCMKVMYRCDLLRGKGWEAWSYERWGFDNWRYDKCMLNAGCY